MNATNEKAYAKINLYLDVSGRRADGYHEIKTVMHSVSLCDELRCAIRTGPFPTRVNFTCEGNPYVPGDARNLAVRAAELFLAKTGISAEVALHLKKKIPISSGLAGGSSDAAAVLRALNRLVGKPFSDKALAALSAELGADVPFCVLGRTSLCEGVGEKITDYPLKLPYYFVIAVSPREHVSTPTAYAALDACYGDFSAENATGGAERFKAFSAWVSGGCSALPPLYNCFEKAILPTCAGAAFIREELLRRGALAASMSGSGPSVYGVFTSFADAESTANALSDTGYFAEACTSAN